MTAAPIETQLRYLTRGCTREAIWRFSERYREYCHFFPDGKVKNVVPRLHMAVSLAKQGKAIELPGGRDGRRIFDVEMPADVHFPAFTLRIVTDPDVRCVLTCIPFHPREGWRPGPVTRYERFNVSTNLGDLLQTALRK